MNELPLRKKLTKSFSNYIIDHGNITIIYSKDPFLYGPQVMCIFDHETKIFLFKNKKYSINQFDRVLDLLVFI